MEKDIWSAADLHVHTTASDGVATPSEVLHWVCEKTDLRVIAIADHNTNLGAIEAAELAAREGLAIDVIVAQETESADGHIIGLWTPRLIRPGMDAASTIAAVHEQGGFAIAAHPFAPRFWSKIGLDRGKRSIYEVADYEIVAETPELRMVMITLAAGQEVPWHWHTNVTPLLFVANWVARVYQYRAGDRFARTGGSDAHILRAIGTSRTYFPGETADDLRAALEARLTTVTRPGLSPARNWHNARSVPHIRARDRERKAREVELGIREPRPERTPRERR